MHAEVQVISPLVPTRQVRFLRFCKQHGDGVWAVVDVSIDAIQEVPNAQTLMHCRRLPSGCVVQDMPNGHSKVIVDILLSFRFCIFMIHPCLFSYCLAG